MNKLIWTILFFFLVSKPIFATKCIAHRGFSAIALENSWQALLAAQKVGADGIELDVHHTLEGIPIVMHDKTLERTATHRPNRSCPLDRNINHIPYPIIKMNCVLKNGEEIPLLNDVLAHFSKTRDMLVVEYKDRPLKSSLNMVKKYYGNIPDRLRIISFKNKSLDLIRELEDPFWKKVKTLRLTKVWPKTLNGGHGVNFFHGTLFLAFWPKLFKREIGVWTVNKSKKMRKVFKRKAHFLTTNHPDLCLETKKSML